MTKEELLKRIENNDVNAMIDMGYLYLDEKNFNEARAWFKKASDFDEPYANVMFGSFLECEGKYEEASILFKKGMAAGVSQGALNLSELYIEGKLEKDYSKAISILEEYTKIQMDSEVLEKIASLYDHGYLGRDNIHKCLKYYEILSDMGYLVYTTMLGVSYMDGRNGAVIDKEKGLKYYYKSADGGWIYGMVNLGLYLCDCGDRVEGLSWLKKASEIDDPSLSDVAEEALDFYKKYKAKFNL
ncbi:MAG: hypothetical protein R3Y05_00110 [bacterium]